MMVTDDDDSEDVNVEDCDYNYWLDDIWFSKKVESFSHASSYFVYQPLHESQ